MEVTNKFITTKRIVKVGETPSESDLELKSTTLTLALPPGSKDVIVKNLYLSVDPYQFNRMKEYHLTQKMIAFSSQLIPGKEISAFGVGKVVVSGNPEFQEGDQVAALVGWEEYSIVPAGSMINKVPPSPIPLSYSLGVLGTSGMTAYAGLFDICKPKPGEKVFVSAASGSVGNLVGQFAKLHGCYVVGCASSQKKVEMLKEKLGFDEAFNYKEEDPKCALKRCFPEGIDVYFDNVGGDMLAAVVANMNPFGRVAVCGVMSEYTEEGKKHGFDMMEVICRRITIRGFLAPDHLHVFGNFLTTVSGYLQQGKLHVVEDIVEGLESIPLALIGIFQGKNVGKMIVKVADP